MFESIYNSFWQHPVLLWLSAIMGFLPYLAKSKRPLLTFGLGLTFLSLLDAWLTTTVIPGIGEPGKGLGLFFGVSFVILGDMRYFLFRSAAGSDGELHWSKKKIFSAFSLSLLVPLLSQVAGLIFPTSNSRVTFAVYEAMFATLVIMQLMLQAGNLWVRRVQWCVLAY